MMFKTHDRAIFAAMIAHAVEHGLTFVATEHEGMYFIEYTGGY